MLRQARFRHRDTAVWQGGAQQAGVRFHTFLRTGRRSSTAEGAGLRAAGKVSVSTWKGEDIDVIGS